MSDDIILKVENISKQYRLGVVGTGTIGHDLNRFWHKVRGKEDPYLKLGAVNDRSATASSEYVWALQDINFEVKRGEILGIIGKNGAGKSTLLKILSRVTSPTTGSIKTRGRIASLLEVGTGMHPELTGRENIFLNGAILGMTKAEIASKIDEIVAFSGCQMYIDTPVKRYSSGMRVRLGFAVAAFLEPDILVVDEVLAVGDAEFQKKAIGKMQDISNTSGRTVLFVSHNMAAVRSLCTRAIVLENGMVTNEGNIDEMVDFYLTADESEGTTDLQSNENRIGNQQFTISKISYLNQNLQPINQIIAGDPFLFKLTIAKNEDIDYNRLIVSIALKNTNDETVLLFSSDEIVSDFTSLKTKNEFILRIPELYLRPSIYTIRIVTTYGTTDTSDFIDTIDNADQIMVLPCDYLSSGKKIRKLGQVLLKGEFFVP